MARVRVRQHVNPLSSHYRQPIPVPTWEKYYHNVAQPLYLDIGCGWGEFLLEMAKIQPNINFLGVEIRKPLVEQANFARDELGLKNLHFLSGNINPSLSILLDSLPPQVLHYVTIQFPDPWFKKRHAKRRVVQPELVEGLANYLVNEGRVFLQSDVKMVAEEMRDRFQEHSAFHLLHDEEWLSFNPLPVGTNREEMTLSQNQPVYRALYEKRSLKV